MKALINVPLLILALLIGPMTLMGQSSKEKKINRELRKIEKASQKLQELQGIDYAAIATQAASEVNGEEIARINEEARAISDQAREEGRAVMEAQREAMNEQRQAMQEQRQAMNEQRRAMREQAIEVQGLPLAELGDLPEGKEFAELKQMRKLSKLQNMKGTGFAYGMPEFRGSVYSFKGMSEDNLTINKTLTDETNSADFSYEVKAGSEGLRFDINGAIDSGKVVITVKRPDGVVYNEYTLSSLANIKWNQTIKFEDQEESQYLGKWVVTVAADKAKGTYSVRLSQ